MNIGTPQEPIQVTSDTPETDAALVDHMPADASEWSQCYYELSVHARKMERERDAARIPICIGRPIIEILAKDGIWMSVNGNSVIAADCLFRNNPYIITTSGEDDELCSECGGIGYVGNSVGYPAPCPICYPPSPPTQQES